MARGSGGHTAACGPATTLTPSMAAAQAAHQRTAEQVNGIKDQTCMHAQGACIDSMIAVVVQLSVTVESHLIFQLLVLACNGMHPLCRCHHPPYITSGPIWRGRDWRRGVQASGLDGVCRPHHVAGQAPILAPQQYWLTTKGCKRTILPILCMRTFPCKILRHDTRSPRSQPC